MFRYKGYVGTAEVSIEDMCLFGQLMGIRDTVLYHGDTVVELGESFQEAVDQYLEHCITLGRIPNKTDYAAIGVEDENQGFKDFVKKMTKALESESFTPPMGMNREEIRQFIISKGEKK